MKQVNPRLNLRVRRSKDVIGLFVGRGGRGGYICRMGKGDIPLDGYRLVFVKPEDQKINTKMSKIRKRGRKTVINFLRNYRWVTNHKQRSMLTWGIDYSPEELKGLSGHANY